jgi:triphosphoribosyl-dephospho-CoA synthase
LAAAAAHGGSLRAQVAVQLAQTSVADARACYRAIRMARPAGLGQVPEQDVAHEPAVDLTAAMRLAAAHDRIARQYANTFADVFEHGVPILEAARTRHRSLVWSTTACYLHLLGNGPDSHIERKYGHAAASAVSRRARAVETALKACENPRAVKPLLMAFDRELKARGINPGTSADLTVASVMAYLVMQRASGECTS